MSACFANTAPPSHPKTKLHPHPLNQKKKGEKKKEN